MVRTSNEHERIKNVRVLSCSEKKMFKKVCSKKICSKKVCSNLFMFENVCFRIYSEVYNIIKILNISNELEQKFENFRTNTNIIYFYSNEHERKNMFVFVRVQKSAFRSDLVFK